MSHIDGIRALIREGRGEVAEGIRPIARFLLRQNLIDALGNDADDQRVVNFDALRLGKEVLQVDPITTGSHALLWASLEGADPIVLLGIDGKYVEIVEGAKRSGGIVLEITEQNANPNYFFEDYQQPGDRYNEPNPRPNLHVDAWRHAARQIAGHTRVVNGNPHSEVRSFPFVDAAELIASGSTQPMPADSKEPVSSRQGRATRLAQAALGVYRKEPLFVIGPAVAALVATLAWALGAQTLAIFMIALLAAAALALQLHFGPRRDETKGDAGDMAILLFEFARQGRVRSRDNSGGEA